MYDHGGPSPLPPLPTPLMEHDGSKQTHSFSFLIFLLLFPAPFFLSSFTFGLLSLLVFRFGFFSLFPFLFPTSRPRSSPSFPFPPSATLLSPLYPSLSLLPAPFTPFLSCSPFHRYSSPPLPLFPISPTPPLSTYSPPSH